MNLAQLEQDFGPLTAAQRRFAEIVFNYLDQGIIPGPTRLNAAMGFVGRWNPNSIGGEYSKLRRFIFEKYGLVQRGYGGRFYWPKSDWRYTERPVR